MTVSEYTKLKERIILEVSKEPDHQNHLSRLKRIFRKEVNSSRRLEQIRSIADLIQILEKRNELADDNVVLLKTIANYSPHCSSELEAAIVQYQESIHNGSVQSVLTSYYDCNQDTKINRQQYHCPSPLSPKKRQLIYETIASEIDSYWRNLARNLDIMESQIQHITTAYRDNSERITAVLEMSERKSDPSRWFFKLLDALEAARRKDLRKKIQEIMMMNV